MLIVIIGNIGTGKTTLTTLFAIDSDKDIYSNYKINIPNYHYLDHKNLFKLPNNIDIFLDEGYLVIESRKSGKDLNIIASHILFQSRKRDINIFLNTQLFSSIDLRFREMANILIECSKNESYQFFQYDVFIKAKGIFIYNKTLLLTFSEAKNYWKYFNTYEIVKSDLEEKYELEEIMNDSEKLYRLVQDISVDIYKGLKGKYTIPNIKIVMLRQKYSKLYIQKLNSYIHAYLNENKVKNNVSIKNES